MDIKVPPMGERIAAMGRVIWYDFGSKGGSYYFMTGILFEKMEVEDRKKWGKFIKNIRRFLSDL